MEIAVSKWLETDAYKVQKELINREVNTLKVNRRNQAAIRLASPSEDVIDYSVFKQTKEEKFQAYVAKKNHKEELRQHFGSDWKKHLNIPSRQISPVKITF